MRFFGLPRRKRPKPSDEVLGGLVDFTQAHSGIAIFGGTGSGKTSGPGFYIANNILGHESKPGACILCSVPTEADRWLGYCEQSDRLDDAIVFKPGSDARCDLLNYELSQPGATVEGAAQLLDMLVVLSQRNAKGGGGEDPYWGLLAAKLFRRAISAVWLGHGTCSLLHVHNLIVTAPPTPEHLASAEWREKSFCCRCIAAAAKNHPSDADVFLSEQFWLTEWPNLSEKTRGIAYSMATNILDKFLSGPVAPMVSGGVTTVSPDDCLRGKIVILDMPILTWKEPGQFFQATFKTLVQRAVLRRDIKANPKPVLMFVDEPQFTLIPEHDCMVQTVARQSGLISVVLTQNLNVLYSAMGGRDAKSQVHAWIGNHNTIIACANMDIDTNEYFSKMCGNSMHWHMHGAGGGARPYNLSDDIFGNHRREGGPTFNEVHFPDVPPEAFGMLRRGGLPDRIVEAVVMQGGRRFADTGKPWTRAVFRQPDQ